MFLRISSTLRELGYEDLYTNYNELVRRGEVKCRNLSFEYFGRYPTKIRCIDSKVFESDGSRVVDGVLVFEGIFKKGGLFKKAVYFGFEVKDGDVGSCLGVTTDGKGIKNLGPKTKFGIFTGPEEDEIRFFNGGKRKVTSQKKEIPPVIEKFLEKFKEPKKIEQEVSRIREVDKLHEIKDTLRKRPSEEIVNRLEKCIERFKELKKREESIAKMLSEIRESIEKEKKGIIEEIYKLNEDNKDVTYDIDKYLIQIRTIAEEKPVGLSSDQILNCLVQIEGVAELIDKLKEVVTGVKEVVGKEIIIQEKKSPTTEKTAQVSIKPDISLDLLLEIARDLLKEINTKLHALCDFTRKLLDELESTRVPELPLGEIEPTPAFASYENRGDILPIRRVAKKRNR